MSRTANPLLISLAETSFQLSLPGEDVAALIRAGDLTAVQVRGQVLVVYNSLLEFTRRAKRQKAVFDVREEARP
jgi:hypothetical protein